MTDSAPSTGKSSTERTIESTSGLEFRILDNGGVASIAHEKLHLNLVDGTHMDNGCVHLYLRMRKPRQVAVPILGPQSPGQIALTGDSYSSRGEWEGLAYEVRLCLDDDKGLWLWDIRIRNNGDTRVELDLLCNQDVGLRPPGLNPAFVSQYIDHTILEHPALGPVVCSRQNMSQKGAAAWMALGVLEGAASAATDGYQFYGAAHNVTGIPDALVSDLLPGRRQYEVSMAAVQTSPLTIAPDAEARAGIFGLLQPDHPEATSDEDIALIDAALPIVKKLRSSEPGAEATYAGPARSIFSTAPLLEAEDLSRQELTDLFGEERNHVETDGDELLSFFTSKGRHVVTAAKELVTERPHGHIIRTGTELVPDESIVSSTSYIHGIFNAQISQGNTSRNAVLSVAADHLNIARHSGQRVFAKIDDGFVQLGVPSAFEIGLNGCRWVYKYGGHLFEVSSRAVPDRPEIMLEIRVLRGDAREWIVTSELEGDSSWERAEPSGAVITITPIAGTPAAEACPGGRYEILAQPADAVDAIGGDELLFEDSHSRSNNMVVIRTGPVTKFGLVIAGRLTVANPSETTAHGLQAEGFDAALAAASESWRSVSSSLKLTGPDSSKALDAINEILPWFGHNALIHYLTPRGLEQYGGGGWGTRDVCQGPFELLMSLRRHDEARTLLLTVFTNQKPDGDWAQAFLFDRYGKGSTGHSHSDIVFWPVLALARYIHATLDTGILDEVVPFLGPTGDESADIYDHITRSIDLIASRFVPGTSLVAFGNGDWNDSMTPADPDMKKQMISSWTVGLSYQTLSTCADLYRIAGDPDRAESLDSTCARIRRDLNRVLVRDGVIAGYVYADELPVPEDASGLRHMLHPSDDTTGIKHRLLPMIRGIISGVFTPDQANEHLDAIREHLLGPDGARLMDRPPVYRGGLERHFQRAETSSFFGREIGIMYMHAHLRYAEALSRVGRPGEFLTALRQVLPLGMEDVVPNAEPRQGNCYFSSSDAAFLNRYEAGEHYDDVIAGKVPLKSGWRIYSSGPGIYVGLIVMRLLGVRRGYGKTVIDPVVAPELDGMTATIGLLGRSVELTCRITGAGFGPKAVRVDGQSVDFDREANPYREGGAAIADETLTAALNRDSNSIEIEV